nr:EXORDIUM family protein [Acidobacteriota bacterium]
AQTTGPNGNAGVDGMLSVVAHELEEATTDPDPHTGWADSGGAENADKCAWTFGHFQYQTANGAWANVHLGTRDFLIQRNLWHQTSGDLCMIDSTHN